MSINFALIARAATVPHVSDEVDYIGAAFSASDAGFILLSTPGGAQSFVIIAHSLPANDDFATPVTLRADITTFDGQTIASSRDVHLALPSARSESSRFRPNSTFIVFRFTDVPLRDPAEYRAMIRSQETFDAEDGWQDCYSFVFSLRHRPSNGGSGDAATP